jgi:hypothetical protein
MRTAAVMVLVPDGQWTEQNGMLATASAAAFRAEHELSQLVHDAASRLCKGTGMLPGAYRELRREPHVEGTTAAYFEVDCA